MGCFIMNFQQFTFPLQFQILAANQEKVSNFIDDSLEKRHTFLEEVMENTEVLLLKMSLQKRFVC